MPWYLHLYHAACLAALFFVAAVAPWWVTVGLIISMAFFVIWLV